MIRAIVFCFVLAASIDASVVELRFFKWNGVVRTGTLASFGVLLSNSKLLKGSSHGTRCALGLIGGVL